MDDGTIDKRQGSMLFETQNFLKQDIEKLKECLKKNFGIESQIHQSGKNRGFRLYIPVRQACKLTKLIRPFMVSSMQYKLSYPRND